MFAIILIGTFADHWIRRPIGNFWSLSDASSTAGLILTWYYLGFGYLPLSAIVLFFGWWTKTLASARSFMVANSMTFAVHSVAVIYFAFDLRISAMLWLFWLVGILYNLSLPSLLWRRCC
jgi:hypothetical protein